MNRLVFPVVGCLALSVSVPVMHEWTLSKARRERVVEESQLLSLRHQLDDARQALADLKKQSEAAPERDQRLRRVETTLNDAGSKLSTFDSRIEQSLKALDALERKTTTLASKASEGAVRETTKVVETVRSSLQQDLAQTESKLRDEMKRLESPEVLSREVRDLRTMENEIVRPIVQLNGDDTVGSGVLIFSGSDNNNKPSTLILSSYHVVRNILAEGGENAAAKGIKTNVYGPGGPVTELSDVVAFAEDTDLVLLKVRGTQRYPNMARLLPVEKMNEIAVFTPVYAVGCPLGNDPIPTQGEIASTRNIVANHNYWMLNAPTYFGNSGGGVFLARTHELIGVFSKIYTHGSGRPTVIPHMGLATPIDAAVDFLRSHGFGFVLEGDAARAGAPLKKAADAAARDGGK